MVVLSRFRLMSSRWVKPGQAETRYQQSGQKWIDSLRVNCTGGHGGNGLPDYGGRGGNGGSVIVEATEGKLSKSRREQKGGAENVRSLYELFNKTFGGDSRKQKIRGDKGTDSSRHKMVGTHGKDKVLKVPPGVTIMDDTDKKVLSQLDQPGDQVTVALGGSGGHKLTGYFGTPGQTRSIRIDYKIIADLGLVGFPNAGKSTLLRAISKARPKIAAYPFTTIKPNLGDLVYEDFREIQMADLPGLIEGASYNLGMGHRFLKHVERTSMLVFVVDVNGFQLSPDSPSRTAYQTVALLNRELELYNPDLLSKPAVCLVNKMDSEGSEDKFRILKAALEDPNFSDACLDGLEDSQVPEHRIEFSDVLPMSAKFSQTSVKEVKFRLRELLDNHFTEANSGTILSVEQAEKKLDLMLKDVAPKVT